MKGSWLHPIRTWRRRRATASPFPEAWTEVLEDRLPIYARLPTEDQTELRRKIQIFLSEKRLEGAGGQEINDEVRVLIAAQACLLLLHRGDDIYPRVECVLVYPETYVAPVTEVHPSGVVSEGVQGRLGEASRDGVVVLSWQAVTEGAADPRDGHNVVYHEFAHQLDMEGGHANGAPLLEQRAMYGPWARVLSREYAHLQDEDARRHRTVMDRYGATNPAEFFAVATETFFEKPKQLEDRHPELYEQLRGFYQQDPARLPAEPSRKR